MSRNWDAVTSARWRWGGCCAVFAIVMLLPLKSDWNFSVTRAQTHPSLWSPRAAPPLFNGGAWALHRRWGRTGCIHQPPCARVRQDDRSTAVSWQVCARNARVGMQMDQLFFLLRNFPFTVDPLCTRCVWSIAHARVCLHTPPSSKRTAPQACPPVRVRLHRLN